MEAAEKTYKTPKTPTFIRGLDKILDGGVPTGGLTLLSGGPGTGKTLIGLEFLVRGAIAGRPGVLISFEEREEALHHYASIFGWDTVAMEKQGLLSFVEARLEPDGLFSGDFDLGGILAVIRHKMEVIKAVHVVIDAPDVFIRLLDQPRKERAEIYRLINWLRDQKLTSVITIKSAGRDAAQSEYEFLEYSADCVILLDQRVLEQVTTRRLRVLKYRGSSFGRNEYPFAVTNQGIWIIPITDAQLNYIAQGQPLPTGVPGLDTLMGGGYLEASCSLITGASGTGKTTFAAAFARTTTANGKRVLYINFEESPDEIIACMLSPGIDMRTAVDSGLLRFLSILPEAQGIEEHLVQAFRAIDEVKPAVIIVDAISACRRMGSRNAAFDYLLRLMDRCKTLGITTLLTNLTGATKKQTRKITGIDLSSLIDTVIVLRYVEHAGYYHRELAILKMRGRHHTDRVHKFVISNQGINVSNAEAELEAPHGS